MKKLFFSLSLIMFLFSCSSPFQSKGTLPVTEYYKASYEETWLATIKALKNCTLKISNQEEGTIVTEEKEGVSQEYFQRFGGQKNPLENKVQLTLKLRRASKENAKEEITKVSIKKDEQIYYELEGWQPVVDDQIIEKTLLYRIGRLIFLERLLLEKQ